MTMQLKICGMKDRENIEAVADLQPDFMGFIFYRGSKRFVQDLKPEALMSLTQNIPRVGVFVNQDLEEVAQLAEKFNLNLLQLHGDELPVYCSALKQRLTRKGVKLIKAFGVSDSFDFEQLNAYQEVVDYFLFDTQTPDHGGSGKKFDWSLLSGYTLETPYFLSGGIGPESIEAIKGIDDHRLFAVDINSRFELESGKKDIDKIKDFKRQL